MNYDAIVIGAGQAGPTLAAFFANQGDNVALAEGDKLGGSCVNYGCTPTKTMRASARVAYQARRAAEFGVHTGEVTVDFQQVMARKDDVVTNSREGLRDWLESVDNLDVHYEYAAFEGKDGDRFLVKIGDEVHTAERVYLNVGTRAFVPPIPGIKEVDYLDNFKLMALEDLPAHLVILGGGYIGLEMGQIFRRFGSDVTIIERAAHVASREDTDVSEEIERIFQDEGITLLTDTSVTRVTDDHGAIHVTIEDANGTEGRVRGSHLLVSAGRVPNTDTLNLESIGLETDERGYIHTNGRLETDVPGVWALGDINRRGAFTHTSYHDYEIVRDNHQGADRTADTRTMAYTMFTDPPLGRVGMSEDDARQSDKQVLIARHRMENVSRAKEDGETNGLVKLLVDADTEEFLGATIFGMQGDDVVQVVSNYMATGASYKHMQNALPIHPTISEFFPTWLSMLEPLE
jgi:pyruvate/2-oxoglutarate dehydrogenase complex dihydrolipoamide dehydrogenase (E3) component